MIKWENTFITELQKDEVFVFGSNSTGFHGAGAAGFALMGKDHDPWRSNEWFQEALQSPKGSPKHIGKWAILDVAKGHMVGQEGESYGIVTIKKPGLLRSVSLREIYFQLVELFKWAYNHPEKKLIISPLGENLAGWSSSDLDKVWNYLLENYKVPEGTRWVGR